MRTKVTALIGASGKPRGAFRARPNRSEAQPARSGCFTASEWRSQSARGNGAAKAFAPTSAQVSFEIEIVGNFDEKSFARCAIFTAT